MTKLPLERLKRYTCNHPLLPVNPSPSRPDPYEWTCPDCGQEFEMRSAHWYEPKR